MPIADKHSHPVLFRKQRLEQEREREREKEREREREKEEQEWSIV